MLRTEDLNFTTLILNKNIGAIVVESVRINN